MWSNLSNSGTSIHRACRGRVVRKAAVGAMVVGLLVVGGVADASDGTSKKESSFAPRVTFGTCELQSTLPFEEDGRIECRAGQVIVAVYKDAVRCCTLEVR